MKFDNLLISLAALAFLITSSVCGDPLNPGMLGETMDMPLPPDLVQKAVKAGVIRSASQVTGPLPSGGQPMNLGAPSADSSPSSEDDSETPLTGTAGPMDDLGLEGSLSLVLQDSSTRYLTLALQQSGNALLGQGNLTERGIAEDVIAEGSVTGGLVNLTVGPVGSSDVYRLKLMHEGNVLKGSYTFEPSGGTAIRGTAAGLINGAAVKEDGGNEGSSDINSDINSAMADEPGSSGVPSNPAPSYSNAGEQAGGSGASSGVAAKAGPVQLGQTGGKGSSFSSSKSISMSTNGGGSMISSTSISGNMGI